MCHCLEPWGNKPESLCMQGAFQSGKENDLHNFSLLLHARLLVHGFTSTTVGNMAFLAPLLQFKPLTGVAVSDKLFINEFSFSLLLWASASHLHVDAGDRTSYTAEYWTTRAALKMVVIWRITPLFMLSCAWCHVRFSILPAGGDLTYLTKGILQVQYKLSLINSICGIITSQLAFSLTKRKSGLQLGTYNEC